MIFFFKNVGGTSMDCSPQKNYQHSRSDKINSAIMILSNSGIYDLG